MGKPPSETMRSLIEKLKNDWLAEFNPLALKAMNELKATQDQLQVAQEMFEHLRQKTEDAIAEADEQVRGIVAARLAAGKWGVEEWLPEDECGPRTPDDVVGEHDYVSDDAAEVLAVMESIGKPRVCASPECNRRFVAAPWGREKKYCSAYCRVKAHRTRQTDSAGGAQPT